MSKVKILLTNDDGIDSIGLKYLWESLQEIGDLSIVAPNKEKSGAGVGVTLMAPLSVEPVDTYSETAAWKVGGTPVDCVKLGVSTLLSSPPTSSSPGSTTAQTQGATFSTAEQLAASLKG